MFSSKLFADFEMNPKAHPDEIRSAEVKLNQNFPADYREFLETANGGEGFIGDMYLKIWAVGELEARNRACGFAEFFPGILVFGSDGAGEAFAFDVRHQPWRVINIPFISASLDDAQIVSNSFSGFLQRLEKPGMDLAGLWQEPI